MDFNELCPQPEILRALTESGYTTPTPVQEQTIPLALDGLNLEVAADTGTGKTAAFLIPSLTRLSTPSDMPGKGARILILVPTRELALQVASASVKYSKYLSKVKTVCVYGGAPFGGQAKDLSRPHEVLVATPGRLIDHMEQGTVDLSRVEVLVLDEADRMLDIEFIEAVETIAAETREDRQTLLFSATLKKDVVLPFEKLLKDPVQVYIESPKREQTHIEQVFYYAKNIDHKYGLLDHILQKDPSVTQAIVFTATKQQADTLVDRLTENGENAAVLHGGMRQPQRTRTITRLRQGRTRILVATDVAARGIDIPSLSHVINFDLPRTIDEYEHRIGRTGRAGAKGVAVSFTTKRDVRIMKLIENLTHKKLSGSRKSEGSTLCKEDPRKEGGAKEAPRKEASPKTSREIGQFFEDEGIKEEREDRPRRSPRSGDRKPFSAGREDRPRRESSGERRPFGNREGRTGDRKPFGNREDRPRRDPFGNDKPRAFKERGDFKSDRPFKKEDDRRGSFSGRGDRPPSSRRNDRASPFNKRNDRPSAFTKSKMGGEKSASFGGDFAPKEGNFKRLKPSLFSRDKKPGFPKSSSSFGPKKSSYGDKPSRPFGKERSFGGKKTSFRSGNR